MTRRQGSPSARTFSQTNPMWAGAYASLMAPQPTHSKSRLASTTKSRSGGLWPWSRRSRLSRHLLLLELHDFLVAEQKVLGIGKDLGEGLSDPSIELTLANSNVTLEHIEGSDGHLLLLGSSQRQGAVGYTSNRVVPADLGAGELHPTA